MFLVVKQVTEAIRYSFYCLVGITFIGLIAFLFLDIPPLKV
ncbi:hypothetical protein THARTR1_09203 [Trichoderma harzianum]|uniref:Uncharacterized protein n=1 Tax=Trichoderma harzianum TaxID=5544 RepID=A0A2K0TX42_TRIHA|nr:hypothetical protein THARTR1_09203 [Trichoderma harzianum]